MVLYIPGGAGFQPSTVGNTSSNGSISVCHLSTGGFNLCDCLTVSGKFCQFFQPAPKMLPRRVAIAAKISVFGKNENSEFSPDGFLVYNETTSLHPLKTNMLAGQSPNFS